MLLKRNRLILMFATFLVAPLLLISALGWFQILAERRNVTTRFDAIQEGMSVAEVFHLFDRGEYFDIEHRQELWSSNGERSCRIVFPFPAHRSGDFALQNWVTIITNDENTVIQKELQMPSLHELLDHWLGRAKKMVAK
jgi:hypothetical protein